MDIRLLETFLAVVHNGSSSAAARILGITQPAVSLQLGKLEKAIGFGLFTRTSSGQALTPKGRLFLDEAENVLRAVRKLGDVTAGIRGNELGALTVAGHPSAAISMLPMVVARFGQLFPDVRLRMINRTSEEILSYFPGTGVDVAVCELPRDLAGVTVRRYRLRTVAILPADHPLAAREALTPTDLSGLPFVAMPAERMISHRVRLAFDESGAEYRPVAEVDFFASICSLVASGYGVSIVDIFSARSFAGAGLVARPFAPAIPYEIAVLSVPDRPQSELTSAFLNILDTCLTTEGSF
ncbi:DNA-binding transcriptional LysR family regulator [Cereibacter changlensis]|uniref:DNA-binding transcriptional LysR family regulator n=2 Tax=Cereibacter changlensis TaxID=402884 RepID=A0A2W7R7B4_9RHOB|nr:LysR family transcriptional regulator [Cereibacter changlensis]PZX56324.1 DNA-binding transcriptional LysR family regulator [Cereibacter changlensis]